MHSSRIAGFYKLSLEDRLQELARQGELDAQDLAAFSAAGGLKPGTGRPHG